MYEEEPVTAMTTRESFQWAGCWLGIIILGVLMVAFGAFAAFSLFQAAFGVIPDDAKGPLSDFVPLGFIVGFALSAGCFKGIELLLMLRP